MAAVEAVEAPPRAPSREAITETVSETVSYNLRHVMWVRSMTLSALSRATGISRAALTRYLNGEAVPSSASLALLACALSVSADTLLGFERTAGLRSIASTVDRYIEERGGRYGGQVG